MELFEEKLLTKEAVQSYRILGQVFDTYWIAEYEEKLLFIDQHAAHEKVKYEALINKLENGSVDSQMLTPPIVLNLSAREAHLLEEYSSYFAQLGFEIEEFGGNAYAVRSVPCDLYGHCEKNSWRLYWMNWRKNRLTAHQRQSPKSWPPWPVSLR